MTHLEAAVEAVREAGALARQGFGSRGDISYKTSDAASVVTKFDTGVEELIARRLREHDPSIPFVGEENGGAVAPRYWLTDPIDGTGYFIRGIPFSTTMIALVEDGKPVLSVIYNFVTDELYTAQKGAGAYLNGSRIYVNDKSLCESYVGIEANASMPGVPDALRILMPQVVWFHTISCGYELGKIAEGKLEARVQIGAFGCDHDFAPGALLVQEAGGVVRTFRGEPYRISDRTFVISNPRVFDELLALPGFADVVRQVQ